MKKVRHGLQDTVRAVRHTSPEHGNVDSNDMYIKGYFMIFFELTTDRGASDDHTSHPEKGNIIIELKFNKPLPEAFTCLL